MTRHLQGTGRTPSHSAWAALFVVLFIGGNAMCADPLDAIVDGEVQQLADGFKFTEGPVWHPDGHLFFSDIPSDRIHKWHPEEGVSVFREPSGQANGLTIDSENRLLAAEHWNRRVTRAQGDEAPEVIAERFEGGLFNSPNDLVVHSSGAIYFTDPSYGLPPRESEQPCKGVYRIDTSGTLRLLVSDMNMPNGLAFSPDEKTLYIADSGDNLIKAFDVAADGSLENGRELDKIGVPDGMRVDEQGRLFSTSDEGVVVYGSDGARIGAIKIPAHPANCAFGGPDRKTLFVTARDGLYSVRVKTPGIAPGKWK